MMEYHYFSQGSTPEIHAAIVGISQKEWICTQSNETLSDAYEKMVEYGFDILPKINKDGTVNTFYHTEEWGKYSVQDIKWSRIKQEDCLYYLTHIKDVIRLMSDNDRDFYFLTNHSTVIGLITIGNLNCKHVAIYYYNLICSLERELGKFVCDSLETSQILDSLELWGKEKDIPSALDSARRFKEDAKKGMDSSIIEYLYLSDLFLLISELQLYKKLGYKTKETFERSSGKLKALRNGIAHPNKSLVKSRGALNDLWKATVKIEELENALRFSFANNVSS
ncbi:hypothetical protein [Flavisolibacter tropicus]|uniref:Uncharacterized protein n=1 Tax=Flavisolibacter tropicus TaxID=1492898 RepID=A0A172TUI9_9BACT|nr:hypothetical protein [Flavisolibacter tropicus]ANE50638.1 hypothetical protein SY85_09115 [Flavisolibacter tropicus]